MHDYPVYKHINQTYRGRQPKTHKEIVKKKVLFRTELVKDGVCVFRLIKHFNVSVYTVHIYLPTYLRIYVSIYLSTDRQIDDTDTYKDVDVDMDRHPYGQVEVVRQCLTIIW